MLAEAMRYYITEDFDKAINGFKKILKSSPANPVANHKISDIYFKLEQYDKALPFAQTALEANKNNVHYYDFLAGIYRELLHYEKSAEVLEELSRLAGSGRTHFLDLAVSYLYSDNYKRALNTYDRAEKRFGPDENLMKHKQKIMLSIGDMRGAVREGNRIILFFGSIDNRLAQARLLMNRGQIDQAEKVLIEAQNEEGDNPHIQLILAEIHGSSRRNRRSKKRRLTKRLPGK